MGYSYLHGAVGDHSRRAYVEALDDETADTLCGFFERARCWFRSIGVAVDEVISDDGANFRARRFASQFAARSVAYTFTHRYRSRRTAKPSGSAAPSPTSSHTPTSSDQSPTDAADYKPGPTTTISTATDSTSASRVHNLHGFCNYVTAMFRTD